MDKGRLLYSGDEKAALFGLPRRFVAWAAFGSFLLGGFFLPLLLATYAVYLDRNLWLSAACLDATLVALCYTVLKLVLRIVYASPSYAFWWLAAFALCAFGAFNIWRRKDEVLPVFDDLSLRILKKLQKNL